MEEHNNHMVPSVENKRARILSHTSNVCEQVLMPEGWERKWPDFYKHLMAYQRKSKSTEHDDAPDCITGVVELMNGEIKMKKKVRAAKRADLESDRGAQK